MAPGWTRTSEELEASTYNRSRTRFDWAEFLADAVLPAMRDRLTARDQAHSRAPVSPISTHSLDLLPPLDGPGQCMPRRRPPARPRAHRRRSRGPTPGC